jgi:hypothetical protein
MLNAAEFLADSILQGEALFQFERLRGLLLTLAKGTALAAFFGGRS